MKAISYGFKSLHPHHIVGASFACSDFFVLQKNQSPASLLLLFAKKLAAQSFLRVYTLKISPESSRASFACSDFFVLQKNQSPARRNKLRYLRFFALQKISRLLRCSSFSQKSLRCNLFCEFIYQIIFPEANRASFACSDFFAQQEISRPTHCSSVFINIRASYSFFNCIPHILPKHFLLTYKKDTAKRLHPFFHIYSANQSMKQKLLLLLFHFFCKNGKRPHTYSGHRSHGARLFCPVQRNADRRGRVGIKQVLCRPLGGIANQLAVG